MVCLFGQRRPMLPGGRAAGRAAGLLASSVAAVVICTCLCVGLDWDSLGRVGGGGGGAAAAARGGGGGGGDGTLLLEAGGSGRDSASSHLDHMFDKVHDDPDVKPNKGATKALVAIDGLGGLPNLSLEPHKRTPAVVRVAKDAGIKIKTSKASAGEEQRAKMAVLAIINGAEGRIKKAKTEVHVSRKAVFHKKMAKALFNYKMLQGVETGGVHDAKPIVPSVLARKDGSFRGAAGGQGAKDAASKKAIFHAKMMQAMLSYRAYQGGGGAVHAKPHYTVRGLGGAPSPFAKGGGDAESDSAGEGDAKPRFTFDPSEAKARMGGPRKGGGGQDGKAKEKARGRLVVKATQELNMPGGEGVFRMQVLSQAKGGGRQGEGSSDVGGGNVARAQQAYRCRQTGCSAVSPRRGGGYSDAKPELPTRDALRKEMAQMMPLG